MRYQNFKIAIYFKGRFSDTPLQVLPKPNHCFPCIPVGTIGFRTGKEKEKRNVLHLVKKKPILRHDSIIFYNENMNILIIVFLANFSNFSLRKDACITVLLRNINAKNCAVPDLYNSVELLRLSVSKSV